MGSDFPLLIHGTIYADIGWWVGLICKGQKYADVIYGWSLMREDHIAMIFYCLPFLEMLLWLICCSAQI